MKGGQRGSEPGRVGQGVPRLSYAPMVRITWVAATALPLAERILQAAREDGQKNTARGQRRRILLSTLRECDPDIGFMRFSDGGQVIKVKLEGRQRNTNESSITTCHGGADRLSWHSISFGKYHP